MIKQVMCDVKRIKNQAIDNPESVVEVVSSVIGDDLILLLTEQSNLYHSQNAQKWKISPKTLRGPI